MEQLRGIEPFSALDESTLTSVVAEFSPLELAPGTTLVTEGDDADSLFILLEGELSVVVNRDGGNQQEVATLPAGAIIGETALLTGGKRTATVRTTRDSVLASLTPSALRRLLKSHPDFSVRLTELATRRLRSNQLCVHLANICQVRDADVLADFTQCVEWVSLSSGEILFRQDDAGDGVYIVISGKLRVARRDEDRGKRIICDVTSGEFVGATALLLDRPRSNTVFALRDTDLARLPRDAFEALTERHPRIMLDLIRKVVASKSETEPIPREPVHTSRTVAIVPLSAGLHIDSFVSELDRELQKLGTTYVVTANRAQSELSDPKATTSQIGSPSSVRLSQWLSQVEAHHDYVIYQADAEPGRWSDHAIRHAEHVFFVAHSGDDAKPRQIEHETAELRRRLEKRASLVLLHEPGTRRPEHTQQWTHSRDIDSVFHVRRQTPEDTSRLARVIAGRAVGLVLGGGGARAWAHLGVLRSLHELGVPIDMIGGTGMGGVIAIYKSQGLGTRDIFEQASRVSRVISAYTVAGKPDTSGAEPLELIRDPWDIEDLWIPYFCMSTDITKARPVCHRSGDVGVAGRATMATPGLFPPVQTGEELLVDGSVLHNLPVRYMRRINPTGPIIAVDVVSAPEVLADSEEDESASGSIWKLGRSKLSAKDAPQQLEGVAGTILRSLFVGAQVARRQLLRDELADFYLNVDVAGVEMLDFDAIDLAEGIGFDRSIDAIREWAGNAGLLALKGR